MYHDRKYDAELNAVGEMAGEAAAAGGVSPFSPAGGAFEPGGGLPGAAEGLTDIPEPPAATPETPTAEPATPEGEAAESPLLATPGKRDGREAAGVGKHIRNRAVPETARLSTGRATKPGYSGHDSISTLQRGITEGVTSYKERHNLQEQRIFAISQETQKLITDLDEMESSNNEAQ